MVEPHQAHIAGCILGTAIGDAIGLPYEGLSRRRAARLLGPPDRHRFLLGRGMVSDDTDHTCLVAQALISSGADVEAFRRQLAWRLRFWLLGLPAGVGLATLRAILRLWIGFGPDSSGIFSAGNGPAMRSAIIGAAIEDATLLRSLVRASSRITHTDPKAEYGALAVAVAARAALGGASISPAGFAAGLRAWLPPEGEELARLVDQAAASAEKGHSTPAFAESLGCAEGVSGYTYHTVPIALHAWMSHPRDFGPALRAVIECGGDTDSTAAIVGGIVGAAVGEEGIPAPWLEGLIEWPRSVGWMERLGAQLTTAAASGAAASPIGSPVAALLLRNVFFLVVVLVHGLRRLLPPY